MSQGKWKTRKDDGRKFMSGDKPANVSGDYDVITPPTLQKTTLILTREEKEDYSHFVNDAARRIYIYLRTERGLDHEEALNHLEEYAQWGEIPGISSPLGSGEPVDNEIRALFGMPPIGGG